MLNDDDAHNVRVGKRELGFTPETTKFKFHEWNNLKIS